MDRSRTMLLRTIINRRNIIINHRIAIIIHHL
jgi:hypothetical protein